MQESGHISINTENILPIIKKWLYSEKEIFIRELVSNAVDAVHKLEKLNILGEVKTKILDPRIDIELNKEAKTIKITDTGLGMTSEEIKRYITQVAFSGLQDFVDKYKGKGDEEQIIGHFGLGFYSSFMVAEKVTIDTLSYQEGAKAAFWECKGDTEYLISESKRENIGTTITLHISEAEADVLEEFKLQEIVDKYCSFMKYPIYLNGNQINEVRPAWTKSASELQDKDYQEFYTKLFPFNTTPPLFWIHLNVDYPFKLRGILYFPKLTHELEASQGQVKLYCNQVYVEDSCKELIPEYLTLLKGVIDSPDIPLNVSRSALQKDSKVQMLGKHITKKVSDKLAGLFKTDRQAYEKFWEDIHPFVKYAMMRDTDFYEKTKDFLLLKLSSGSYVTPEEYLEKYKDKTDGKILYSSDSVSQASYLALLKANEIDAVLAESMIDKHFVPYFEMLSRNKYPFLRVDAEVSKHLIDSSSASKIVDPTDNKTQTQKLEDLFKKHLSAPEVDVRIEALKSASLPGMLILDETKRRMKDMAKMGQFAGMPFPDEPNKMTLIVNQNSSAIKNLLSLSKSFNKDDEIKLLVRQVYDLALLQQGELNAESMQNFIERSSTILAKLGTSSIASEMST